MELTADSGSALQTYVYPDPQIHRPIDLDGSISERWEENDTRKFRRSRSRVRTSSVWDGEGRLSLRWVLLAGWLAVNGVFFQILGRLQSEF